MPTQFTSVQNRTFGYRGTTTDEKGNKIIKRLDIGPFSVKLPTFDEIRSMSDDQFKRNESGDLLNAALATAENAMQQPLIGVIRNKNQEAVKNQDASAFSLAGVPVTWEEWDAYVRETGGQGIAEARKTFLTALGQFCDDLSEQRGIPRAALKQIENACKSRDSLSFMNESQKEKVKKLVDSFMLKLREHAADMADVAQPAHDEIISALTNEASIDDIDIDF